MARRAAYVNTVTAIDTAVVLQVDCGDMIGATGALEEIKARYLYEAYGLMHVDVLNFGSSDALLGQDFLLSRVRENDLSLVSANTYYFETGERFLQPYVIRRIAPKRFLGFEWGGLKVGIFGVVQPIDENAGLPWDKEKDEHRLIIKDPVVITREIVEELKPRSTSSSASPTPDGCNRDRSPAA